MKFEFFSIFNKPKELAVAPPAGKPNRPEMNELSSNDPRSRLFGKQGMPVYDPSELMSRYGRQRVDEMRRDDQIKAALSFKKLAVTSSGWEIVSPEEKDRTWEVSDFVRTTFENLNVPLNKSIKQSLSALEYGFSASEKVWAKEDSKIVLKAIKCRRPHEFTFEQDQFGNVTALNQQMKQLPVDKFVVYSYNSEFGNPYGTSDMEAAYRAWWSKKHAYQWLSVLLERMGIPPIFFLYNPTSYKNQMTELKQVVQNLQAGSAGVIPRASKDDLDVWSPELVANVQDAFLPAIAEYDKAIARAILMPSLIGVTGDSTQGSLARSQTHFDSFLMVVEELRSDIEDLINKDVVKQLVDYNFAGVDQYPTFKFLPMNDEVKLDLMKTWADLVTGKVVTQQTDDEAHIRSAMNFPEANPENAVERVDDDAPADKQKQDTADDGDENADGKQKQEQDPKQKSMSIVQKYAELEAAMDVVESELYDALKQTLEASRDDLIRWVSANYGDAKLPSKVALRKMSTFQSQLQEGMRNSFGTGRTSVREEMPKNNATAKRRSGMTPPGALSYLSQKAVTVTGIVREKILGDVKVVLLNAIANGETLGDTTIKLKSVYQNYIQETPDVTTNRLQTIIRTNITDAINRGRLVEMRDPDMALLIEGVRYSALLDRVTTNLCRFLDGKMFRLDDPELDNLTPPNHFNCRSILIPITVGDDSFDGEFITAEDIGKAKDLMDQGFGGTANHSHDNCQN